MKKGTAIRVDMKPLRLGPRAARLRIRVWQIHFWRKRITRARTCRVAKAKPNPRTHTDMNKNIENLNTVKRQVRSTKGARTSASATCCDLSNRPLKERAACFRAPLLDSPCRKRLLRGALSLLAIGAVVASPPARGSDANINIVNFAFSPNTATINVNDIVTWTWVGSDHTTTSYTGVWDSGVFNAGHTFSRMFTSAGSFPFHCTIHPFMTGTITVQSVNVPPTVSFTNPPDRSVFAAPASFTLSATASDSDGSVTNVELLQGASVLGNITTPPYSVPVSNLGAGNYSFSAVAADNAGSRATNTITISVVAAGQIQISAPQWLTPSLFQFSYSATVGSRYVIQRSPNLAQWTALSTNTAEAGTIIFTDQDASGDRGFYRVGLLPNP